jgi:polyisoprenoid-binding protein YceI
MSAALAQNQADVLKGTWVIDPVHTNLGFHARHAMVTTVRGSFEEFSGTITIDPDHPEHSSAEVEIKAASVTTRAKDRDAHLASPDFLDAERHPTLTFRSTRVETGDDPDQFVLWGDLTVRGVTRPVRLDMTFHGTAVDPFGNLRAGFEGETTVNRKDWELTWNAPLEAGGWLVGDKVKLHLDVSAVKQQG